MCLRVGGGAVLVLGIFLGERDIVEEALGMGFYSFIWRFEYRS